jgi:hypothetical protein
MFKINFDNFRELAQIINNKIVVNLLQEKDLCLDVLKTKINFLELKRIFLELN